ncbi:Polyketide cyclase / dehydrase and lipid transport [Nonomuraea solani]|uniref:Polyketide cyclase / dehydrase and lipid transport n=2 Tax=Nonomuraea solani TaxID=1144553 RepID=A0A1H6DVM1_9ACTN|nr:Polyketide cyclase / dehydrase and lipid transport [Nonomuraea solani]
MYAYEHALDTTAPAAAVWARYAAVNDWTAWDTGLLQVDLEGPFEVGTEGTMTPAGQHTVRFRIVELVTNELFTDETVVAGMTLRFIHRLTETETGTRVVHRVEITGPGAEQIGPAVTSDVPEAMAALVKLAEES